MLREKTVANVLRPIFTVLMVFLFIYGTYAASIYFTVLTPKFWSEKIFDKQLRKEFTEMVMEDDNVKDNPYKEELDGMSDTLVNFILDEIFDGLFEQDYEVDYDKYEEMFEEEIQPVLEEHGASKAEIKESKNDIYDSLNKSLNEELFPQFEETIGRSLYGSRINMMVQFISCFGIILVFTVVLILIHKNKFKPLRNLGIAMTIGQGLATALCFLIYGIFTLGMREVEIDSGVDELAKHLVNNILDVFFMLILIIGATFVLGIVLIIVFGILTGKKNKAYAKENPPAFQAAVPASQYYNDYAQTLANQPLQNNYQPMQQQYTPQYGQQPMQQQYAPQYGQQPMQQQYAPQYGQQPQMQQPQYSQPVQQTYTPPVEPVVGEQTPVYDPTLNDDLNATTYGEESSINETTSGSKIVDWDDELE
ncbi:MAG: hypothetical protein J6U23_10235 [Clostridiales bacterium]|nr:hypothetical protein [Clostridiales bacterium]